jgi:hypothetical protein
VYNILLYIPANVLLSMYLMFGIIFYVCVLNEKKRYFVICHLLFVLQLFKPCVFELEDDVVCDLLWSLVIKALVAWCLGKALRSLALVTTRLSMNYCLFLARA